MHLVWYRAASLENQYPPTWVPGMGTAVDAQEAEPPSTPRGRAVDLTTKHFPELREISLRSL